MCRKNDRAGEVLTKQDAMFRHFWPAVLRKLYMVPVEKNGLTMPMGGDKIGA